MVRDTTKQKEKKVIQTFHKLLRSGKDYTTKWMYGEAGRPCFLTADSAGNLIRKYYKNTITEEMIEYLPKLNHLSHESAICQFAIHFDLCNRESRLIIRYIRRRKQ